ncbi:MAG TPA: Lrp/AsnC family transcriptional regulator [Gemmatimonadales bacterium]|nr:Lrp/AsnC family transcriptional regulator [Gemmatimonadales bacterium]
MSPLAEHLDGIDLQILAMLQRDARTPNAEIARQVGMAPSAILERVRKLEGRGVLRGYHARIDPQALGLGLVAFVFVRVDDRVGETKTSELVARIPGVQEVHHIAGEDCLIVKVRAPDTQSLGRLLREEFGRIDTVRSTRTTIVLETVKESGELPLPAVAPEDPDRGNHD